ncbi:MULTISPECIES: thioesterase II family protein [Aquimarina]|uniref:thioesterase II family protein n=1 Tax=Aquimarina TaxID=290174 RepID=UPI000481E9F4|nr:MULTISPECIES: thioesterase domain-containing protein [Aquimarina]AXT56532.1 thioesterase [Aquimarina sp. AD1]
MHKQSKPQLFLLHFAGGSCYSFDFLKNHLDSDFDFIPLELPGRGKRNKESFLLEKTATINDYFKQIIKRRNDMPYLIYGHSMGATLGLSVTKKMEEIGDAPNTLIVSGNAGPGMYKDAVNRYLMEDLKFKEELKKLGGVPNEILDNDELYDFFSPIMRADFEVLEKNRYSEEGLLLSTNISAIMGEEEENVSQIENWSTFTKGHFDYEILSGNHFFIHNHETKLSQLIKQSYKQAVFA